MTDKTIITNNDVIELFKLTPSEVETITNYRRNGEGILNKDKIKEFIEYRYTCSEKSLSPRKTSKKSPSVKSKECKHKTPEECAKDPTCMINKNNKCQKRPTRKTSKKPAAQKAGKRQRVSRRHSRKLGHRRYRTLKRRR